MDIMIHNSENVIKNNFGHCKFSFENDYVHIYDLFIKLQFRKQGRAREILQTAINEIRKTGYIGPIKIVAKPTEKQVDLKKLITFYKNMKLEVYTYYG